MFSFPNEYYDKNRRNNKFLTEYLRNTKTYVKKMHPEIPMEEIETRLREIIDNRLKDDPTPIVSFTKKTEGADTELNHTSLLKFTDLIKDDIITSSGSMYQKPSEEKSFFVDYILSEQTQRKKAKGEMLRFEEVNDSYNALLKHFEQLSKKVGVNGISGTMCSNIFFKSLSCYNSITSTVRHNIMLGYASIEKLLEGNLYFEDENDAINLIVSCLNEYPGDERISKSINKYHLKIPSQEDIKSYLSKCIYSTEISEYTSLNKVISNLSDFERAFVFYAQNLKHIFQYNTEVFKKYFDELFEIKYDLSEILKNTKYNNKEYLSSLEDNTLFILSLILQKDIVKNHIIDDINKNETDIRCILKYTYYDLEYKLSKIMQLLKTFIFININLHKPFKHTNMIRKTVILSDTDSIIFTSIRWIRWYTGSIAINQKSINFHSLLVFLSNKFLDYIYCIFSRDANIGVDNLKVINIKSEFFYTSLLRTGISKHYAGLIMMQEGIVLPKPKFDYKGKNFKGSDLSVDTLNVNENFVKHILHSVEQNPNLDFKYLINYVAKHEDTIYQNLKQGKTNYLPQKPIKNKTEYKIPYSSNWFYYHLWESVFTNPYNEIVIPQKCKSISLSFPISTKTIKRIEFMKDINNDIYDRLIYFINKYPKKKITQIIIPPSIDIPKEVRPIIDYKKIIYGQCYGLYLILRSFNIGPIEHGNKFKYLISEIYFDKTF